MMALKVNQWRIVEEQDTPDRRYPVLDGTYSTILHKGFSWTKQGAWLAFLGQMNDRIDSLKKQIAQADDWAARAKYEAEREEALEAGSAS